MPNFTAGFDDVTAPSMSPGWNLGSFTGGTTTGENSISPTSSPNMAKLQAGSGSIAFLTYGGGQDTGSGNLWISANCNAFTATNAAFGVAARGSASSLTAATDCYVGRFDWTTGGATIDLFHSGSRSTLASSGTGTTPSGWKTLTLTLSGTSLSLTVYDPGTGHYLQPGGTWTSSSTPAITATNATLSGAGYVGLFAEGPSHSATCYFDDVSVPSVGPIDTVDRGTISGPERGDSGRFEGRLLQGVLSRTEANDGPSTAAVSGYPGAIAATDAADFPTWFGGFKAAVLAASDHGDAATTAAVFKSSATLSAAGHGDAASFAGLHRNGALIAASEGGDSGSIAGAGTFPGRIAAREGGDSGGFAGSVQVHAALAVAEAGDRGAIAAVALGVPPSFKAREAGDVGRFIGSSPTLHYNVYMSDGPGQAIDYATPVASTAALSWTSARLGPGVWGFGVRATNANGEDKNLDVSVYVTIAAGGLDATNTPAPPAALSAIPQAGGKVVVDWHYPAASRARYPTGFRVYRGVGAVDYGSPVATVSAAWVGSLARYSATISGLSGGTAYRFGVRAFNASGEETNTLTATAVARTSGPDAVKGLSATAVT